MNIIDSSPKSRSGNSDAWPNRKPVGLGGLDEQRWRTKALVASVNPHCEPRQRWRKKTLYFFSLSPSCFKQISCFRGLSCAAENRQCRTETFDMTRKKSIPCVVFSLLTRRICVCVCVIILHLLSQNALGEVQCKIVQKTRNTQVATLTLKYAIITQFRL